MPIIRRTYLNIAPEQRRESAGKSIQRLQETLMTPGLSEEQASLIRNKIEWLRKWAEGKLGT